MYKANVIDRPIVDEWFALFRKFMGFAAIPYKLKLSHDIDSISRFGFAKRGDLIKLLASDIIKRRQPIKAILSLATAIGNKLSKHDPYNVINLLLSAEAELEETADYYFILGGKSPRDALYEYDDQNLHLMMRGLLKSKANIGIHLSYECSLNQDLLETEGHDIWN